MSIEAYKAVWTRSRAKGAAQHTLLAFAEFADDSGLCWPSAVTIARMLQSDERWVRRLIAFLVAAGELMRIGTRSRGVVVYRIACVDAGYAGRQSLAKSPGVTPGEITRSPLAKSPPEPSLNRKLEPSVAAAAKQAVELFNSLAAELGLPPVQRLTANRRSQLAARLADIGGLDGWQLVLGKIRETPGLHTGDGWRISFDWLLNEQNLTRIIEGTYDGWDPTAPRNGAGRRRDGIHAALAGLYAAAADSDTLDDP